MSFVCRICELHCPYRHVLLLLPHVLQTRIEEIHVVEKAYNTAATSSIYVPQFLL